MTPLRLEPAAPRSRVKHSTTEPLRSRYVSVVCLLFCFFLFCFFFKIKLLKKLFQEYHQLQTVWDPDHARCFAVHNLGPDDLQIFSAKDKSFHKQVAVNNASENVVC